MIACTKHYSLDRDQLYFLKTDTFRGWEIVDNTARLCAMNFFLHGIGSDQEGKETVIVKDSLLSHPSEYFDMVLTNPPFGRKSSLTIVNEKGRQERGFSTIVRDDFWVSTNNKQLNFLQHVFTLLKPQGRAAIVVPITYCLKEVLVKPFAASSWRPAMSTLCCDFLLAYSTRRASKPMSFSSTRM